MFEHVDNSLKIVWREIGLNLTQELQLKETCLKNLGELLVKLKIVFKNNHRVFDRGVATGNYWAQHTNNHTQKSRYTKYNDLCFLFIENQEI